MRRLGSLGAVLLLALAVTPASARSAKPHIVISDVTFGISSQRCEVFSYTVSNRGDVEEPAYWTVRIEIPKLGLVQEYSGQQPVAPGASFASLSTAPVVTTPGRYRVIVSAVDAESRSTPDRAFMDVPCG
jgi:hypothetical protein